LRKRPLRVGCANQLCYKRVPLVDCWCLVVVLMVVVITVLPPTIMVAPMAVVVFLVVPMSFVQLPAFAIVVVMRMCPVCPFKGRTIPMSPDPPVTVTYRRPISLHPNQTRARRRPRLFINERRWWGTNVHRNLR
jgi:hypothetical protein